MEHLNLSCGRYVPASGDTETRVRRVEDYLASLSEELERMLQATGVSLGRLEKDLAAREEGDA